MPFVCAYCPADGLSTFWPITSTPAATRLSAAFRSFAGSNQDFVQTIRIVASGRTAWTPSAKPFVCRMISGIGNGTMYPTFPFFVAAPAAMPER